MQVVCKGLGMLGITCSVQQPSVEVVRENYINHLAEYGISYGTQEEFDYRFQIYLENDKAINEINAEPNSFVVAHNFFSTLSKDEQKKWRGRMPAVEKDAEVEELDTSVMAKSVDWRNKGVVSKIQNQGQCGSCWAFSSTAAIESSHALKTGKLLKLAEQQFVDCDYSKQKNQGCNGGLEQWAFQYAEKTPLMLESDYGYTARKGKCKYNAKKGKVDLKTYKNVKSRSVAQLKAAVS